MTARTWAVASAAAWLMLAGTASAQSNTDAPAAGLPVPPPHEVGAASVNNPTATSETEPGAGIGGDGASGTDTAKLSPQDRTFVEQAEQYARAEIAAGRLAVATSKSEKVQIFARQAIGTGEQTLAPLRKLESAVAVTPQTLSAHADDEVRQLDAAKGTVFDGLYGDLALRDQQALIALYDREAQTGGNGELKSFAATERQHVDVLLHDAQLLKAGTIDREDPNCPAGGPAKFGCP
jgi:predicted outer membrane protein